MSWTLHVPATPRDEIYEALDKAEPSGQDAPGVSEAVAAAKDAARALVPLVRRDYISVQLNGHVLQPDEDSNWYDGVSVQLSGSVRAST